MPEISETAMVTAAVAHDHCLVYKRLPVVTCRFHREGWRRFIWFPRSWLYLLGMLASQLVFSGFGSLPC